MGKGRSNRMNRVHETESTPGEPTPPGPPSGHRGWWMALAAAVVLASVSGGYLLHRGRAPHARGGLHGPTSAARALPSPSLRPHTRETWVAVENRRPGTDSWRIRNRTPSDIEGYADHVSGQDWDAVSLFVSTGAPRFRVVAYRLGYYQGLGGRLVWRSREFPGMRQPPPVLIAPTNTIEARWKRSARFRIGDDWPSGAYLLKLVSSAGDEAY